jgi:hypothetical protein
MGSVPVGVRLEAGWAEGGALSAAKADDGRGRAYPVIGSDSFEIFARTTIDFSVLIKSIDEYMTEQTKLSRIVPGDIFYYRPGHIAIVADVYWYDDGRVKDLRLIESTFGHKDGINRWTQFVLKQRKLTSWYLKDDYEQYLIVRLKRGAL